MFASGFGINWSILSQFLSCARREALRKISVKLSLRASTMLCRLASHGAQLHTFLNAALSRGECSVAHRSSGLVACIAYQYALKNREMYCLWRQMYTISSLTGRLRCLHADWANVAFCFSSLSRLQLSRQIMLALARLFDAERWDARCTYSYSFWSRRNFSKALMVFSFGVVDAVLRSNTTLSVTNAYFAVIDISYVHIRRVE